MYHIRGSIAKSGTTLTLTDEDFMFGTVKVTDATSSSNTFDIGAVITNTFECTLNNYEGKFDGFDFDGAVMTIEFGVVYADDTEEWIQRGVYRVDKPDSLGSTIQVKAFDYMDKLNRYYALPVTYPINAKTLVENMCTFCGVSYDNDFWDCASNPSIAAFEFNESITCRAVLNWICQICGVYARVNNEGKMTVKWYHRSWGDSDDLNGGDFWANADTADGGTINPWSVVADYSGGEYGSDWIASQVKSITVGIDNITITGIRAYQYNTVDEFHFAEAGNSGYILKLENNPLITADNLTTVANRVYSAVGGMAIQPFKASIYGDPSMEAGDSITLQDYRGRYYNSYITNLTFSISGVCEVSLGATTPNEKELEFTNPSTGVIQGATRAAYDYISARKIDGYIINAGTLNVSTFDQETTEEVETANGQITTISGGGISVHENGDTSNEVTIKSDGVRVFASNSEVAKFGRNSDGIGELRFKDGLLLTDLTSTYQSYASGLFGTVYSAMLGYMDSNNDVTAKVQVDDEYISLDAGDGVIASLLTKSANVLFRVDSIDSLIVTNRDPQAPFFAYKVYNNGNLIPTVGEYTPSSNVNVATATATDCGHFTLPKGVWTVTLTLSFPANANGSREVWLSNDSAVPNIGEAYYSSCKACDTIRTRVQVTCCLRVSSDTTYYIGGYQNSGSTLAVTPRVRWSGFKEA